MAPIEIQLGWFKHTLKNRWESVQIPNSDVEIAWGGDDLTQPGGGQAIVFKGQQEIRDVHLPRPGDTATTSLQAKVPPVDYGEEPTTVKRDLIIKRT